jgi:hypothetical protein
MPVLVKVPSVSIATRPYTAASLLGDPDSTKATSSLVSLALGRCGAREIEVLNTLSLPVLTQGGRPRVHYVEVI